MADGAEPKIDVNVADVAAEAAAQKAYAAASQKADSMSAEPTAAKAVEKAAARKAVTAKVPPKANKTVAKPATATKPLAAKKAAPAKSATKPIKPVKAAAKTAAPATSNFSQFKDTIMAKTQNMTEDYSARIKDVVADVQGRAKTAFEKTSGYASEYGEFAKGNVEALVETGKILAAGLQDMGKDYVAEGKSALETMNADVKLLAAVRSPTDFFKLQGEIMRRNFDAVVATGSKNSEKLVKLANDAMSPISSRVSIAVDKIKQAA